MRTAPVIAIVVAALLSAAPRLAQAQSDYPIRPVSLIVPYASGGVADVAMRLLGDKLSNRLGRNSSSRTARVPAALSRRKRQRAHPPMATRC
jgi:tripartite-type tricarboxylate transporter receptor subunit TctC